MNQPLDPLQQLAQPIEMEPVNRMAIRRQSVIDSMLTGAKRGMTWGSFGGIGLTGVATAGVLMLGSSFPLFGLALGGASIVANGSFIMAALGLMGKFMSLAIPAIAGGAILGAVIGGTMGAISGLMNSGEEIDAAEAAARRAHKQSLIERGQMLNQMQQAQVMGQPQMAQAQPGNLVAPATPMNSSVIPGVVAPNV